ncbi:MAG: bifunctional hydroxymethylpyrimidine kinase/phosphomethylpyrimidine kinase [Deltaproteobacteria bacterium]|nr:bifunctional hydroxymethylpyrimidine kinase/phosphomethylpyrimidine kinase [Deltaproteobacteria bacterium]
MDYSFLKKLDSIHLLVAGEVGIDEYIWGDTSRISPEAPVPVIEVESQSYKLGLAANVVQNIVSLGAAATLVTVCGEDEDGNRLGQMLSQAGVRKSVMVRDSSRPTLRKTRIIAQKQHVVRVDYEKSHPLAPEISAKFGRALGELISQCDGVIVQDYAKGIWNADTMSFIKEAQRLGKPVFVDPSRLSRPSLYRGATLLTPNIAEAETLCGFEHTSAKIAGRDDKRLLAMATKIMQQTEGEHIIITCGEWGMVAVSKDSPKLLRIPTYAREVFDVTGAGDTVIAVLALMRVMGQPLSQCMQVANAAAGIVVGKIGTASVTRDELVEELGRLQKAGLIKN